MPLCTALLYSKKGGKQLNKIQMKTAMQIKCLHKAEKKRIMTVHYIKIKQVTPYKTVQVC